MGLPDWRGGGCDPHWPERYKREFKLASHRTEVLPFFLSLLQAGVEKEELRLALQLKEETNTHEIELMHLRIRAIELELSREPPHLSKCVLTPSLSLGKVRWTAILMLLRILCPL